MAAVDGNEELVLEDLTGSSLRESASLVEDEAVVSPPIYHIDLDAPAEKRWKHVIEMYREELKAAEEIVDRDISDLLGERRGPFLSGVTNSLFSALVSSGAVYYSDEIKAMAKVAGIPVGKAALLQLVYEAAAQCTAFLTTGKDGVPIHARTMDWEMDFLKPLTVTLIFFKGGKEIFRGPSWAGYVGILTGLKKNAYSVSVNFRLADGTFWDNVKCAAANAWPIGFLVRECLSNRSSYAEAVAALELSDLIAPTYFVVCGVNPGEGILLTRGRSQSIQPLTLSGRRGIVQPNQDHWDSQACNDVMNSRERRQLGYLQLEQMEHALRDDPFAALWLLLSQEPIWNDITVYGAVMCPATGEYEARLPNSMTGFLPAFGEPGDDKVECARCHRPFNPDLNPKGFCSHAGTWHSTYADCSKIKCAMGLGASRIGLAHYSCCYSTDFSGHCPKSNRHEVKLS
mmetsp:Transcript_9546/g.26746  ORF Transcript_9546/g.26746 Transcript_9546/m.26746 type:complete len:457 (+) Transcript_9546:257-1627(+)